MLLGISSVPILFGFCLYDLFVGNVVFSALIAVVAAVIAANTLHLYRTTRALVPFTVINLTALGALEWGILTLGLEVTLWAYPLAIVNSFVSERRPARILMAVGIGVLLPTVALVLPPEAAVRFAATYLMVCLFSDMAVSSLERLQDRLNDLAIRDPLTGAFNRRCLDLRLDDAIEQHRRGLGAFSLIALDVDHFKQINDGFGHDAGDQVLVRLVETVQERLRAVDALFRMGGEEFVILCRGTAGRQAHGLAEAVRCEILAADLLPDRAVTVSLGVVEYDDTKGKHDCLRRADQNLYRAKQCGRNRVWPPEPDDLGPAPDPGGGDAGMTEGAS